MSIEIGSSWKFYETKIYEKHGKEVTLEETSDRKVKFSFSYAGRPVQILLDNKVVNGYLKGKYSWDFRQEPDKIWSSIKFHVLEKDSTILEGIPGGLQARLVWFLVSDKQVLNDDSSLCTIT